MYRGVIVAGALIVLVPVIASAASCSSLSRGSSGPAVTAVQKVLYSAYQGFPSPTGYFGTTTEAAVQQWQGEHGIEQLGIVGPQTAAAMKIDLCTSVPRSASVVTAAATALLTDAAKASLIQTLLAQLSILQAKLAQLLAVAGQSSASTTSTAVAATGAGGGSSSVQGGSSGIAGSSNSSSSIGTAGSSSGSTSSGGTVSSGGSSSSTSTIIAAPQADPAVARDAQRLKDLQAIKTALEQYFLANGAYPGDASTYYFVSDNNYSEPLPCATTKGLKPYLSTVCTLKDPEGQPYAYALKADGTYTLGAMFETAQYRNTAFLWGPSSKTLAGYYDAGLAAKPPSSFCLAPSPDFRTIAQRWLSSGHSLCLTAGDFDISSSDGSAGLTIDGTAVSRNGLTIRGAGEGATALHYTGCGTGIDLKGTLRNLDIGNLSLLGGITSYYTDGTSPSQCSQQIAIGDEVGSSNIVNANFHNLTIKNVRLGISLMGGCTSYAQPSSRSCYCTGTTCDVDNVIQDNDIENIYGMRYVDSTGGWTDQSTGIAIGSQVQQGLIVRRNTIRNVSRHSIYISFGYPDGSYYIWDNTISNHRATGVGLVDFANLTSAIVVARSQSYTEVLRNSITDSNAFGISIETGPIDGGTAVVSNNTFSQIAMPDIWVDSTGPVTLSGNTGAGSAASCVAGTSYDAACTSAANITIR